MSLFLIYFMIRFVEDDRFSGNRFALEFEQGQYIHFIHMGGDQFEVKVISSIFSPLDFVVFSDIKDITEPK